MNGLIIFSKITVEFTEKYFLIIILLSTLSDLELVNGSVVQCFFSICYLLVSNHHSPIPNLTTVLLLACDENMDILEFLNHHKTGNRIHG
jgi:hypothetical protein